MGEAPYLWIIFMLDGYNQNKGLVMKHPTLLRHLFSFFMLLSFLACSKTNPIPDKPNNLYTSSVDSNYLNTLDFKNRELVAVKLDGKFYYINKEGKKMLTLEYDGKADEFSDGLARTKVNGKVGFFNKNLEMVLKPMYDFAFPFHKGVAEICMGCKEQAEGDTSMLDGGTWKKIDREGLVIE